MDPLWADLLNSDWHDHRGTGARADRLDDDAWLGRFLGRAGWDRPAQPGRRERNRLHLLRALLRRLMDATLARHAPAPSDVRALDAVLALAPLHHRVRHGPAGWRLDLASSAGGMAAVLGRVAHDFAAMLARGEPERLKLCANADCGWAMWDESRNRSRRWCESATCGNLVNVRRFRSRHRHRRRGRRADGPRTRRPRHLTSICRAAEETP